MTIRLAHGKSAQSVRMAIIFNSQFSHLNSKNMKKYLMFMEDAAYEVFRYLSIPAIVVSSIFLAVFGEFPVWAVHTAKRMFMLFRK